MKSMIKIDHTFLIVMKPNEMLPINNTILKLLLFTLFFCTSCGIGKIQNEVKEGPIVVDNNGIAGNTTLDLLNRVDADVLGKKSDLVILMVGTNDMLNSNKFVSYRDYEANLTQIVRKIKKHETEVLLMSSPTVDSVYLFGRHDKTLFEEDPNIKLQNAKNIVAQVAKENNTLYLDVNSVFSKRGLPVHNQDDYIINEKNSNKKDGVHLTSLGYKFIAKIVFQYLVENNLQVKYKSIVCFGDSLTKGSGAKGAGTITGENYPSFLNQMLNEN